MSNLVPVQMHDKNGVLTTRWVRPADNENGTSKGMPAPVLAGNVTEEEALVQKIKDVLNARDSRLAIPPRSEKKLATLSPELLHKTIKLVEEWPEDDLGQLQGFFGRSSNEPVLNVLVNIVRDVDKMLFRGEEDPVEKVIALCNKHRIDDMDTPPGEFHYSLIKAEILASYVYLSSPSRALIPHQQALTLEKIRANMDVLEPATPVIAAMVRSDTGYETFDYDGDGIGLMMEVAEVVQRYPGKAEAIAKIVTERGGFNADVIDQVLQSAAPAISEGVL